MPPRQSKGKSQPQQPKPQQRQQQSSEHAEGSARTSGGEGLSGLLKPVVVFFVAAAARWCWQSRRGGDTAGGNASAFFGYHDDASAREVEEAEVAREEKLRFWRESENFFTEAAEEGHLLPVTTQNFNSTVEDTDLPVLLAFIDSRSKSFRDLRRHLEETAEELERRRVAGVALGVLGVVDVTVDSWLAKREAPEMRSGWQATEGAFKFDRPRNFPMILRIYVRGERLGEYTGVVSAAQILRFLSHLQLPKGGLVLDAAEAVAAFLARPGPLILGCGLAETPAMAKAFAATAKESWGGYGIGQAAMGLCKESLPETSFEGPTLVWLRGEGSGSPRSTSDSKLLEDPVAMQRWMSSHKVVREMTPDNSHVFLDIPDPLVIFLVNPRRLNAMRLAESLVAGVEAALSAKKSSGDPVVDFQFVWSDCKEFASQFGVKGKCRETPVVALVHTETLEHKTMEVANLIHMHPDGDGAAFSRAEELLSWLRLGSKGWRPEKSEKERVAEEKQAKASREERKAQAKSATMEDAARFVDAGADVVPHPGNASWFAGTVRSYKFDPENPHFTYMAYHELLHHLAKLEESFGATHASYLSFDFSELREVQRLHPDLRALPLSRDIRRAAGQRKSMRGLWKRVEAHTHTAALLGSPGAGKNQTLRELGSRAAEGFHRLRRVFVSLFEALHEAARQGEVRLPAHRVRRVERRDASELSLTEFLEKYAAKGQPVIISGLQLSKEPWTLEFFRRTCNVTVELLRKNSSKRTWGRLESAGDLPLSEFIDTFATNETRKGWYLHDWSLPTECPMAFGEAPYESFVVPKYFAGDYFQRSGFSGYQHSWPSLFVGSELTESAVHIDSGNTNFWMFLLSGRKEWRFYRRSELVNLYLSPGTSHFFPDVFRPQHDTFPLLKFAELYEGIQEAGDLMFIPAGNPHGVRNLAPIHGVSMNYVDASNIWLYLEEALAGQMYMDFELFTDNISIPLGLRSEQGALTFGQWKSQRWRDFHFDLHF